MKKFAVWAVSAITTLAVASCGHSTPKADLENEIDSLSYAMGMANTNGLEMFLEQRYGLDSTNVDDFIKGLNEGVTAGDDKSKAAYYAGIQIGQQVANQMIKGINQELFGEDSTKTISLKNFMAGFISGYTGKGAIMTQDNALMIAQTKMEAIKAKNLEAQFAENKAAGERFLASNKNEEGVITLPSGLQYKVLTQGTGAVPADTSKVSVHYEGTLLDGTVFDSSYERKQPATFMANQVIKGWTEILQIMPVGSTYEVYIPQQLAYGAQNTGKIKPFSCLKFKIELLGIEK